uniref:Uncharacterized protein n=1 Tax=Timema bartmani TaxID=61472 RepID=A0A7R9HXK5_9NEOP|nr:unnamed protein product [Timema bartmani]
MDYNLGVRTLASLATQSLARSLGLATQSLARSLGLATQSLARSHNNGQVDILRCNNNTLAVTLVLDLQADDGEIRVRIPFGSTKVHPTEIRTLISPSLVVWLNTTGALANYATEAVGTRVIGVKLVKYGLLLRESPGLEARLAALMTGITTCDLLPFAQPRFGASPSTTNESYLLITRSLASLATQSLARSLARLSVWPNP